MMKSEDKKVFRNCPMERPDIVISPSDISIQEVDCQELQWWGIIPLPGKKRTMAIYDLPEWTLSSVTELSVAGTGTIHGVQGAIIKQEEWIHETTWKMERLRVVGRLTDDCVQWLAMINGLDDDGEGMVIRTFLDEEFQAGFPDMPRRITDSGNWKESGTSEFTVKNVPDQQPFIFGAGTFNVTIGGDTIRCLRVLECSLSDGSTLIEGYLDKDGNSILMRRYNGFNWQLKRDQRTWDQRLKGQPIVKINGISFIHWYDSLFFS